MMEAIRQIDFSVVCGHRSVDEQFGLFKIGRKMVNGSWVVVDKKKIVTKCDGYNAKSYHNYLPSRAVDIIPYPSGYKDLDKFRDLSFVVKDIAKVYGVSLEWGGDWRFVDYPHWQL